MKINKTLNIFANESLEKYNNQNFLAELLQKIQPPIVENNSLKLNKLVISTFSVALVLALSIPIIVNSSQAKNPTVPINSTVPTTSNPTSVSNDDFYYSEPIPIILCRYQNYQNFYDIDNVVIKFSYGSTFYNLENTLENGLNIPNFDIVLYEYGQEVWEKPKKEILYKSVNENLVSEKYKYEIIYDENKYIKEAIFNHSEDIKIPKELFIEETGRIMICIQGNKVIGRNSDGTTKVQYVTFNSYNILYKIENGKVVLYRNRPDNVYFG